MKIAVTTTGETLESQVAQAFEQSAYLLIVETDDLSYEVFKNPEGPGGAGLALTGEIIRRDCEAVITGSIEKEAFTELVIAQVTRYAGANYSAKDALVWMEAYALDYIRVPNGEVWEPHDHGRGECNCGHDDAENV